MRPWQTKHSYSNRFTLHILENVAPGNSNVATPAHVSYVMAAFMHVRQGVHLAPAAYWASHMSPMSSGMVSPSSSAPLSAPRKQK